MLRCKVVVLENEENRKPGSLRIRINRIKIRPEGLDDEVEEKDAISSGNFGKLVRAINQKPAEPQIRLNLYEIKPDPGDAKEDRCARWLRLRFQADLERREGP